VNIDIFFVYGGTLKGIEQTSTISEYIYATDYFKYEINTISWTFLMIFNMLMMELPWFRGHRHLTENQDLRLWVQSPAMPAIFQSLIAKKSTSHPESEGNSKLHCP